MLLIRSNKAKPREVALKPDFLERLREKQKVARTDFIIEYKKKNLGIK